MNLPARAKMRGPVARQPDRKVQVYERSQTAPGGTVAPDYDSQLIESVTVRRNRLTTALLFGDNPAQRRWMDSVRLFLFSIALAAVVAAVCVGVSFVSNLLEEQRERQEQQNRATSSLPLESVGTDADPSPDFSPYPFPGA